MTDENCIFCKIAAGKIPSYKIFEDEQVFAFLDKNPDNPGHTLLIPKGHFENIYSIPNDVMAHFGIVLKNLAIAVKKGMAADGINFIMNNGNVAGQIVHHAHMHIIPRFEKDGLAYTQQGNGYKEKEELEIVEKITSAYKTL